MNQTTVRTMPARSGDTPLSSERRVYRVARQKPAGTARRRWVVVAAVLLVIAVAVVANMGPLSHFRDARSRLNKVTTQVSTLDAQRSQLQQQLAKLNEAGYLEMLARQQLTYARPGEDVYIVTGAAGSTSTSAGSSTTGEGTAPDAPLPGMGVALSGTLDPAGETGTSPTTAGTATTGQATGTTLSGQDPDTAAGEKPGMLERILSAIRGLF